MQRTIRFVIGFISFVLVLNIVLLDYFFVKQRADLLDFQTRLGTLSDSFKIIGSRFQLFPADQSGKTTSPSGTNAANDLKQLLSVDVCPNSCISLIGAATVAATLPAAPGSLSRLSTSQLVSGGSQTSVTPPGEFFIPLGSGTVGNTVSGNWTNIDSAQATFDAGNFGSIKQAYFDVIMYMPAPSGELHARLFDKTTPAIFFNSEAMTTSGTAQFFELPITLPRGQKTYTVQMYNTLASTGTLSLARIRIVTQ